jgi:tRNA-Thr(GGU) m(6)t(6)A37 methyltransferase TsaA
MELNAIGRTKAGENSFSIHLFEEYVPALWGLEGYSHLQLVLWADRCDTAQARSMLSAGKLFRMGPESVGIFATRAPVRPNPLLISVIGVERIDYAEGVITMPFIDALDGTPVLDIKPYNRMERVRECTVPRWCDHWPEWYEEAERFDWAEEISFPDSRTTSPANAQG